MKRLLLAVAITCSISSVSLNTFADQFNIDAIENAAMKLNLAELEKLNQESTGYDKGLAEYRLGLNYSLLGQQEQAINSLTKATKTLEQLTNENENDVEAWALLSQVYGLRIAFQPMKGATLGPKSFQAIEKANSLNATNPRVLLVQGVSKYNTPAMFGGNKHDALDFLSQAIEQYEHDKGSEYHWGFAEAYTWRGLAKLELGNKAEAIKDFKKAIEISPQYGWAQNLLMKNS